MVATAGGECSAVGLPAIASTDAVVAVVGAAGPDDAEQLRERLVAAGVDLRGVVVLSS